MSGWRAFAVRLADQLRASGDLTTPAWYTAIAETPRHVLVPIVYESEQHLYGSCTDVRLNTAEHLELIYSTTSLVTSVVPNKYGSLTAVSSSTKPDLMVRMLETLDVHEGQRILEIGTGTGYNAALLAHRLGDDNVFSLDIDPELVNTARRRLARVGHRPHLATRHGADGWPEHAPYQRIIGTCAVRRIPWTWYDQLAPGGKLLVDFKPHSGNLVLLERKADRLEGRFTARYGAFMIMRQRDNNDNNPRLQWRPELPLDRERTTMTPAEPPGVIRFLRSVMSSTPLRHRYTFDEKTRQPTAVRLAAADGSCCEVALIPAAQGTHTVREGGPTPLWEQVECAYQQWRDWGEPGWNRVGVTIRAESWSVWLDEAHHIVAESLNVMPWGADGGPRSRR